MLPQVVHSFQFDHLPIRVLTDEKGEPWFVAKDVAALLGYSDTAKAVKAHCRAYQPVGVGKTPTLDPQTLIIPERDLYRMVMRSRLESAERFEEWVVGEVLPSIRKTGAYAVPRRELTRMELLQLAMDSERARLVAEEERDRAIATKALIGSKREATAMATASAASRKARQLEQELGRGTQHATITAVENASGRRFGAQGFRPLKAWCKRLDVTAPKVNCPRYGEVRSWPAMAWMEVYGVDLVELFGQEVEA